MQKNTVYVNPENSVDISQKWEEPFRDLLDEIYYPGYAKYLASENPKHYNSEYFYFISLYDEPLP